MVFAINPATSGVETFNNFQVRIVYLFDSSCGTLNNTSRPKLKARPSRRHRVLVDLPLRLLKAPVRRPAHRRPQRPKEGLAILILA
jgi:hypothetical protein